MPSPGTLDRGAVTATWRQAEGQAASANAFIPLAFELGEAFQFDWMAQVLAIVLRAGLDAVLVAVELALETGPPGKVSVEHVVNVLGRLNAAPVPQTAATSLQVTLAPLANTARYDSLRGESGSITRAETHHCSCLSRRSGASRPQLRELRLLLATNTQTTYEGPERAQR